MSAPAPAPARKTFFEDALLGVPFRDAHRLLPGAALAAAVVAASLFGAKEIGRHVASGKSPIAGPTLAILLGLAVVNTVGVGAAFKPGLEFCVRKVLRFSIVLVGIRLSFLDVAKAGGAAIPAVFVLVLIALGVSAWLARRLGVSPRLGILAAASTAICGVTATLAVAPAVDAEEREVAYTVANVTLYGILGMLLYPYLAHALFAAQPAAAGLFLGTSIHETAQVAGAALAYRSNFGDQAAMDAALVAKLVRNTFLVAVVPALAILHARSAGGSGKRPPLAKLFPVFVLGFLAMAIVRSMGDAGLDGGGKAFGAWAAADWKRIWEGVAGAGTEYGLGAAMAALGLTTRFASLREMGPRPLLLGAGTATAVAAAALGIALLAARFAG